MKGVDAMLQHLRIARPVRDLARTEDLYCNGLALHVIDRFADHDGFDGVMIGIPGAGYHFEFTVSRIHPVRPMPTPEDLVVFYVPEQPDWEQLVARMLGAGFKPVCSHNPYWDICGRTFEDCDGYRVVLQPQAWRHASAR